MPRKVRPYRPKTRGCFECSKRRISCDRTEPCCQKCSDKGLKCSGLGIRHRFSEGVAVRGFWKGKSIQEVYEKRTELRPNNPSSRNSPASLISTKSQSHSNKVARSWVPKPTISQDQITGQLRPSGHVMNCPDREGEMASFQLREALSGHIRVYLGSEVLLLMQPSASKLPSWKMELLSHFSDHIAIEMVAIDGQHNGWRHMILPLALTDDLILKAVLAVSSFHIDQRRASNHDQALKFRYESSSPKTECNSFHQTPSNARLDMEAMRLYAYTIETLQRRSIEASSHSELLSILLSILILLVATMVTGLDDFPVLFRVLESALEAIGGEDSLGGDEIATFILRQVHKMRVYAAPLLSEEAGIATLSSQTQINRAFECLRDCSQQKPEHSSTVSILTDLIQQSYDIYLQQADASRIKSAGGDPDSIYRVHRFKETLESLPTQSPGRQVLIWATFVAASDSVLEEHRRFFANILKSFHERSGFENILKGIDLLQNLWARKNAGERWISFLPQGKVFIM